VEVASQKNKLIEICNLTAKYWHNYLLKSANAKNAREYLKDRQIDETLIDEFNIGYAPDSWEETSKFLKEKGYNEQDIFLAGLTVKKDKGAGFYDRFRGRLIFPISSLHGDIIAFGARTLKKDEEGAKYINSPQTMIYNKSLILYNMEKAKSDIKRLKFAILVEGYTDIIASHKAGVKNVIASSGTALTLDQVNLLKRYTDNLAIAYDADLAGEAASTRGIDIALGQELNVKVISLPEGKDPADLADSNPDDWKEVIKSAKSIMEYYFEKTFTKLDISKVEDKKKAASKLLTAISKLGNKIEQTHWLQKLSEKIKVPEEILRETLDKSEKSDDKIEEERPVKAKSRDRMEMLSEQILAVGLKYSKNLNYIIDHLKPEMLIGEKNKQLYKNIVIIYTENVDKDNDFLLNLSKKITDRELSSWADTLILLAEKEFFDFEQDIIRTEVVKIINVLKKNYINNKLKLIEEKIGQAESQNNQKEVDQLIGRFKELTTQLNLIDNNL